MVVPSASLRTSTRSEVVRFPSEVVVTPSRIILTPPVAAKDFTDPEASFTLKTPVEASREVTCPSVRLMD
ncbi:hypothetical protein D3C73_1289070 [compost metagenome]